MTYLSPISCFAGAGRSVVPSLGGGPAWRSGKIFPGAVGVRLGSSDLSVADFSISAWRSCAGGGGGPFLQGLLLEVCGVIQSTFLPFPREEHCRAWRSFGGGVFHLHCDCARRGPSSPRRKLKNFFFHAEHTATGYRSSSAPGHHTLCASALRDPLKLYQ